MKSFHITIKDNNTNEILVDDNYDAILGACSSDDGDKTTGIGYSKCTGATLLSIFDAMFQVAKSASGESQALWHIALKRVLENEIKEVKSNDEDRHE